VTGKASDASAAAQDTATGAASHAQKVAGDSYGHAQKVAGDSYGHAQKVAGDSYDAAKGTAYDTAASGRLAAHDAAAQAGTTWEKAKNVVADVVDKVGRLPAAVSVFHWNAQFWLARGACCRRSAWEFSGQGCTPECAFVGPRVSLGIFLVGMPARSVCSQLGTTR
jgi:hypothetical protein